MYTLKNLSPKTLLSILAFLVLLICVSFGFVRHSLSNLKAIGQELIAIETITDWQSNENSPVEGIVNIGDGLYEQLKNHNVAYEQIQIDSMIGDCFGDSSKFVSHSIMVMSPNDTLCIRLRYDPLKFKYHVVGYSGTIK